MTDRQTNVIASDMMHLAAQRSVPWEKLERSRIFISGGGGFLARYLIRSLMWQNDVHDRRIDILAVVRSRTRLYDVFPESIDRKEIEIIESDICLLDSNSLGDFDYIIHAASPASPRYYGVNPIATLSPNIIGTYKLLNLAHKCNALGFLYFSSAEVYGQSPHVPTSEYDYGIVDPLEVRSCYAESKRMAETMCVSWWHQHNVPVKIVRPFHTYGPGMQLDDGRVYSDFVSDILNNRDIELKSDGAATRAFCYLVDATAGFWIALLLGQPGVAYNVGSPQCEISIRELADLLVDLFPDRQLKVRHIERRDESDYLPSKVERTVPDITKMMGLGWKPKFGIKEGFRRTIESYMQ